jgi:spore coat polysaccharide biosynthesis protein SpsF
MRSVAIITARWLSTRLPGKMLADINGKPLLQWVVDRCRQSKVDDVVVATTKDSLPIIQYCMANKIHFYIGDEDDIVSRLYHAAVKYSADVIIRVWGDCPLVNPKAIDLLMEAPADNHNFDFYYFTSNDPKGMGAGLLSFGLLEKHYKELAGDDRHWYHKYLMAKTPVRCTNTYGTNLSHIDLSVDDEISLNLVRAILV